MKRRSIKILSLLLAVLFISSIIICNSVMSLEVKAAGLTLAELQAKYPHGKYWNHANTPGNSLSVNSPNGWTDTPCPRHGNVGTATQTCNGFTGGGTIQLSHQCMGFAEQLGYLATGFNPRNNVNGWSTSETISSLSNLKPGDIVRYRTSNQHSIYITAVNGDSVTFADCNIDGKCGIRWGATTTKGYLAERFIHLRSAPSAVSGGSSSSGSDVVTPIPTTPNYIINIDSPNGSYSLDNHIEIVGWVVSKTEAISYVMCQIEGVGQMVLNLEDASDVSAAYPGYAHAKRFRGVIDKTKLTTDTTYSFMVWAGIGSSQSEVKYISFQTGTGSSSPAATEYLINIDYPKGTYSGSNNIEVAGWVASTLPVSYAMGEVVGVYQMTFSLEDAPDVEAAYTDSNYKYFKRFRGVIEIGKLQSNATYDFRVWAGLGDTGAATVPNTKTFYTGKLSVATSTLSFDANGGTVSLEAMTANTGSQVVIPSDVPVKSGYTFLGWATTSKATSIEYYPGAVVTLNKDITLYAIWQKNHTHSYSGTITTEATCTAEGVITYVCSCGDSYTDEIAMIDHTWSEWIVMTEPTTATEGEQLRYCKTCRISETETIPVLEEEEKIIPELITENYKIKLTEADSISHIRYASGVYETASEIKNAADCVDLSSSVVAKNTADGIFSYEMANGGIYSLWIKMSDGTTYIMTADLSVMEQEVEAYGVTVTVKNLYGVKDFFIAKGEYDNYTDVKNNYIFNVTSKKIAGAHNYKYILSEPGTYTVCIRYDDTTRAHKFITFEAEVVEPIFTENGLQLTVGNLDDIKVIRTAYGEYSTPGEIKRAEGARAFTAKTIAKSGEDYTIQYRENGTVSVAVVYNNGYEVMYTYEVEKKVPNFVSSGNSVIIGNLDGLNLVRYAEGEYTTSNQIKNAAGSKVLKSDSIVGGYMILELDPGTYTFCVQYLDESYNYYTVTVE